MDTLHAQKENVDANFRGRTNDGKLRFSNTDKFSTPKRGFVIHDDSKSASSKGLNGNSSKKSRRVLSDISNKQRNNSNPGAIVSIKKTGLGKSLNHSKKLTAKKRTPLKSKSVAPLTQKEPRSLTPKPRTKVSTKSVIKVSNVEEVPDIEHAYGGLSSPKSKSTIAEEMAREIEDLLSDKTPTLFDSFEPTRDADDWDDSTEKAMLEGGEFPSPWWAPPELQTKTETEDPGAKEEKEHGVDDDLSELPPPDNLPDTDFDDGGLLEDILSVDFEAACGE